jgi:hypothetical protein
MSNDGSHSSQPDVSHINNLDVSHETRDVRIRPIFWFVFWLITAVVIIYFLMFGLFKVLERHEVRSDPVPSPLSSERQTVPPEPRLQLIPGHPISPFDELKSMRQEEEEQLSTYGWVDETKGIVRLPIEKAKEKLLEQGLPTRRQPQ